MCLEPLPDNTVRDAARNTILKTVRTRMGLLGLDVTWHTRVVSSGAQMPAAGPGTMVLVVDPQYR